MPRCFWLVKPMSMPMRGSRISGLLSASAAALLEQVAKLTSSYKALCKKLGQAIYQPLLADLAACHEEEHVFDKVGGCLVRPEDRTWQQCTSRVVAALFN